MRNRTVFYLLCFVACVGLAGCGGSETDSVSEAEMPVAIETETEFDTEIKEEDPAVVVTEESSQEQEPEDSGADEIDVDLTQLSSTMVYGEVYQMVMDPDKYVGKTIKMRGQFYSSLYAPTGKTYYFVLISDATACCSQGLEFVWDDGSHIYPDEYPVEGDEIEITGVFETYMDPGDTQEFFHLLTDDIMVIEG